LFRQGPTGQALVIRWLGRGSTLYTPALWLSEVTSALDKGVQFDALLREEGARVLALAQTLRLRLMATRRDWPTT
jgi:hypothetical protein